jgi:hypothetical protein
VPARDEEATMTKNEIDMTNEELLGMITHKTQYEFMRRQTVAQQEAAQAAKDTATYTRKNARYMLVSVIVLTLSALGTFILALLNFWR